jgi:hypothetical protein
MLLNIASQAGFLHGTVAQKTTMGRSASIFFLARHQWPLMMAASVAGSS